MKYFSVLIKTIIVTIVTVLAADIANAQTDQERFETAQAIARTKLKYDQFWEKRTYKTQIQLFQPIENRNDKEEQQINSSPEPESEIHAAINPIDTTNIIVSAMRLTNDGTTLDFSIYYSKDFGQSWKFSSFHGIPPDAVMPAGGGDPVLVFDSLGHAHFFWLFADNSGFFGGTMQLRWATSKDGGETWEVHPDPIAEGEFTALLLIMGELVDKEWAAYDNSPLSLYRGTMYFAYSFQKLQIQEQNYQIHLKRKLPGESKFEKDPIIIASDEYGLVQFVSLDTDREGGLHLLFYAQPAGETEFALFYRNSTDGGATFSDPLNISYAHVSCFPATILQTTCKLNGVDPLRVWPCNSLRVDDTNCPTSGNLYVVWSGDGIKTAETEGFNIYFSKSEDGGISWADPIILNDDFDPNGDIHHFFPALEVTDNGAVVVSWYDRREDPENVNTKYYMTYSTDGGNTFVPDFPVATMASNFNKIGGLNGSFGVGEYTTIISTENYAIPIWADGRTNDGNIDIYASFCPILPDHTITNVQQIIPITVDFKVVNLFPNPASDELTLDFILEKQSAINISITNTEGKLVKVIRNTTYNKGKYRVTTDVSDIEIGAFTINIRTDYGLYSKLFIVSR